MIFILLMIADEDFPKCRFLNLPFHNIYRVCDYCGKYKKIAVLNQPVYYDKGKKRKLVSYCNECDRIPIIKRELVDGTWKYLAYDGILEVIKNSTSKCDNKNEVEQPIYESARKISFEDAVRKAYYRNNEVSRYLGYSQTSTKDPNYKPPEPFDLDGYNQRVWQFRYMVQHEEPRVKVLQHDPLVLSWNSSTHPIST
jgi:hypothetical protein